MNKGEGSKRVSWVCGTADVNFTECKCSKCAAMRKKHPDIVPKRCKAVTNSTDADGHPKRSAIKKTVKFDTSKVRSGMSCPIDVIVPEIYDMYGNSNKRHILKLDSCSNRDLSPYINDFISIRRLEPHEREDIQGIWGKGQSPEYVGTALYWLEDTEGYVRPFQYSNVLYKDDSHARIASNAHLIDAGIRLDLYE